jgi:predicted pyridoxine 5'-phosphate oxidase superfamily flavin-nucleotide-binding protein
MTQNFTEVAFTPSVKAVQQRRGSRDGYRKIEERLGWRTTISSELVEFIAERDSIFFATASASGQPYVQHRGGPKGFIHVLDEKTLAFADYQGNRQYITVGNLTENDKAFIFMIDYAHRRRIKLWGHARVVENDPELVERLMPAGYEAKPEQVILFTVSAWDSNCHQHIPRMVDVAGVAAALERLEGRIAELEEENRRLKASDASTRG